MRRAIRSQAEHRESQRLTEESESQTLAKRGQDFRESQDADERAHATRRHGADIHAFRSLIMAVLAYPSAAIGRRSRVARRPHSEWSVPASRKVSHEEPGLLEPELRTTFFTIL